MTRTLRFEAVLTPTGIEHGRAVSFDADGVITGVAPADPPWDGFLALPGMPNAHSHAFQRALTGRGEAALGNDSFWSWREEMYRLANSLQPEDAYSVARMAFTEMLAGGFTHLVEFHYLLHGVDGSRGPEMTDAVLRAADAVGLPLTLLPVYYRTSGFDAAPAEAEQHRFVHESPEEFLAAVARLGEAVGGVAPHSLRAVPAADLAELVEGASGLLGPEAPLHIHVSEQATEVEECGQRFGRTPIELLFDHVEAGPRWNLVHATHATPGERVSIRESGAGVVLCPLTEAYLGDGIFEAREHLEGGGVAAIGTDSNVRISAIEELRVLEYGQRLRDRMRARLGDATGVGAALWSRTAEGGARASGRPVGRLEIGGRADIIVLNGEAAALAGHRPETAIDAWLVGGDARDIAAVYVKGDRMVEHGVVAHEEETRAVFAATMRRLRP
ncbi:MAG: formimidoylglutamate deiminase [Gemmatimonadota bacterium]|nr:formimidoylglutamate deiminase [Gemmatimonadota bacterium]